MKKFCSSDTLSIAPADQHSWLSCKLPLWIWYVIRLQIDRGIGTTTKITEAQYPPRGGGVCCATNVKSEKAFLIPTTLGDIALINWLGSNHVTTSQVKLVTEWTSREILEVVNQTIRVYGYIRNQGSSNFKGKVYSSSKMPQSFKSAVIVSLLSIVMLGVQNCSCVRCGSPILQSTVLLQSVATNRHATVSTYIWWHNPVIPPISKSGYRLPVGPKGSYSIETRVSEFSLYYLQWQPRCCKEKKVKYSSDF